MRALPILICLAASTAHADCPMQIDDLPPANLVDTTIVNLGLAPAAAANGVSASAGGEATDASLQAVGALAGQLDHDDLADRR
jgi:hypothetical protein